MDNLQLSLNLIQQMGRERAKWSEEQCQIPWTIPDLDELSGGIYSGGITMLYGDSATGKTQLALIAASSAISLDYSVAWIDLDNAFHAQMAAHRDVELDKVLLARPSGPQEGLELILALVGASAVNLVVVDSLGGLTADMDIDDYNAFVKDAYQQIAAAASSAKDTAVLICNQVRQNIQPMRLRPYGGPTTIMYSDQVFYLRRLKTIYKEGIPIGIKTGVRTMKMRHHSSSEFEIEIVL